MVINQATKELDDKWMVAPGKLGVVENICNAINDFLSKNCNESYGIDVDVDVESREIIIGTEFDLCEFKNSDAMITILQMANDILITKSEENEYAIRMEMRFDGVWVKNE